MQGFGMVKHLILVIPETSLDDGEKGPSMASNRLHDVFTVTDDRICVSLGEGRQGDAEKHQ